MPRQCWAYSHDLPVMQLAFQTLKGLPVTKLLEVDCGATGGISGFVLSEND